MATKQYQTSIPQPKPVTAMPPKGVTGLSYNQVATNQQGMDREQLAQVAQQATALAVPTAKPAKPPTTNIPVAEIKPAPSLQLPQQEMDTGPADGMVMGVKAGQKSINDYLKSLEVPETETQKSQKSLISQISTLLPQTEGQGTALAQEEKKQGVDTIKKEISELNASIMQDMAAYESAINREQLQTGNISSIVKGRQAVGRMVAASDIGLKQARLLGLQGNLEAAMSTAARAVDLRYQDVEDKIATKEKQLEVIQPLLDADEAKQADALGLKLEDEKMALEERKADQKANLELAFTTNTKSKYANKSGKIFRVSDGFSDWTPDEFLADAGVGSFEEAYAKGLITDIDQQKIQDMDFVLKLRNEYADAGINFNDSVDTAIDKLGQSNKYYKENYMEPETPDVVDINGVGHVFNPESGLYEEVYTEGGVNGPTKPLSAEASKVVANSESGISNIDAMARILNEKGTVSVFTPNFLNQSRKQYFTEANNLVDVIGRMRSGGAITEDEEARFKSLLPKITDSSETWGKKLTQLRTLLEGVKSGIEGGSEGTNPKVSNQVLGTRQVAGRLQPMTLASVAMNKYPEGATGGQCGDFARKVVSDTGRTYPRLGNGLNEKVAVVQKYGIPAEKANVGSVVVTKENPTYGHVAVILQKTPQGVIVAESNFKQSNKVSYGRLIPYSKIVGAINPTKA